MGESISRTNWVWAQSHLPPVLPLPSSHLSPYCQVLPPSMNRLVSLHPFDSTGSASKLSVHPAVSPENSLGMKWIWVSKSTLAGILLAAAHSGLIILAHLPIRLYNGITPNNPTCGRLNPPRLLQNYWVPTTGSDYHSPLQDSQAEISHFVAQT